MNTFHPVSVTRLYRMIADQIAGRIRSGHFQPGERLPSERELAEQLQVSRPSIREALIALEIEGYVEVRVGAGVYVTKPKQNEVSDTVQVPYGDVGPFDLIAVRLLIEPECAALAAQNASDEQIEAIGTAAKNLKGSLTPRLHDREFHVKIAESTGNEAMANTVFHLLNLRDDSEMLSRLEQHFITKKVWQLAEVEHKQIYKAIKSRDVELARKTMTQHLVHIQERLREDFSNDDEIAELQYHVS